MPVENCPKVYNATGLYVKPWGWLWHETMRVVQWHTLNCWPCCHLGVCTRLPGLYFCGCVENLLIPNHLHLLSLGPSVPPPLCLFALLHSRLLPFATLPLCVSITCPYSPLYLTCTTFWFRINQQTKKNPMEDFVFMTAQKIQPHAHTHTHTYTYLQCGSVPQDSPARCP